MKDKALIELIIVLILAVVGIWSLTRTSTPAIDSGNGGANETVPTKDAPNSATNVNTPATISYSQALSTYKDTRIQLDQNCRAIPNNVTYKNNTSIMIDNRSDRTRAVKVGSSFSIPAYGFKIVKLSSSALPVNWYVDCDGSQNVATILIQK